MEEKDLIAQQEAEERKNQKRSMYYALGVLAVLVPLMLIWPGLAGKVPPPEQIQWVTVGSIDYGNNTNGSSNVNNFADPSPTPSENSSSASSESVQPTPVTETASPVTTESNTESPATRPTPTETPSDGNNSSSTPTETVTETPRDLGEGEFDFDDGGGSNHGDGDEIGNSGNPNSDQLSWGNGIGNGTGSSRKALKYGLPQMEVTVSTKIQFKLTIDPNGRVLMAQALGVTGQNRDMARKMEEKIKRDWLFSKGNGNLITTVTVSFWRN